MSHAVSPGGTQARALAPAEDARTLADHMAGADGVFAAILEETVASAEQGDLREAGRTACGSVEDLRRPFNRFPTAVELAGCPVGVGAGIWHTHVSRQEFRRPTHSLPDWSNVVFGHVNASAVVGTEQVEVVMAAQDPEAMRAAFQDALGVDVRSKRAVIASIMLGAIEDPDAAQQRVARRLEPLVQRRRVSFPDLDARAGLFPTEQELRERIEGRHPTVSHHHGVACHELQLSTGADAGRVRERSRAAADTFEMVVRRFGDEFFTQVVAVAAGQAVGTLLLGE